MAVDVFENIVSKKQQQILLDYFNKKDDLIDSRPDVFSKSPKWNVTKDWPQETLKKILDAVFDVKYQPENVFFYSSKASFRLHVDSGEGNQNILHKNTIIPLYIDGPSTTIIFKNKWRGGHVRFGIKQISPFNYDIPNKQGKMVKIEDIRKLKDISHLDITQKELDDLILLRSGKKDIHKPDERVTDYSLIEGYNADLKFDPQIHEQYCNHIPIENLHGLTIDSIIEWKLGDIITFDRQHLHCAGSGHNKKMMVSVFTNVGD